MLSGDESEIYENCNCGMYNVQRKECTVGAESFSVRCFGFMGKNDHVGCRVRGK